MSLPGKFSGGAHDGHEGRTAILMYRDVARCWQYCDLDEFLSENGLPVEGDQHQNGTTAAGNVNAAAAIVVAAGGVGGGGGGNGGNGHPGGALMPGGVNGRLSPPPPASIHPIQIQHLQTNGGGGGPGPGPGAVLTKREPSPSPSEPLSPITISPPSPADSSELSQYPYYIMPGRTNDE